jgi:hypothetical protein
MREMICLESSEAVKRQVIVLGTQCPCFFEEFVTF